ncbi:secreted RxLR effector protein 161-like [Nicotiana tabacum]|uniref:Secreted RxLR effector protein 161-like n=1 Tax=Nicotiana tabacum TaxID=4097 RepID=A0AC58SMF4_TOBAC
MELNHKPTTVDYDNHVGNTEDKQLEDAEKYQKLIGKLFYLTITRPDISFGVQVLSQFMQNHKQSHLDAALRVVRYIKVSPGLDLLLKKGEPNNLTMFCDSDWAACPNTRRSTTEYIVKPGDSPLSWKSKKQQTISRSSVEAEYRSTVAAVVVTIWMAEEQLQSLYSCGELTGTVSKGTDIDLFPLLFLGL